MAKLTNLIQHPVLFRSSNGVDYSISVGSTITVPDAEVKYELVDSAIENGWLDVSTDFGSPFFDGYGNISGGGAGSGTPVDTGLLQPLTEAQLRSQPVEVLLPSPLYTPSIFTKEDSGTIPSGAISVDFLNMGETSASVAGGPLPPGVGISFRSAMNGFLDDISYSATGTTLLISETR